MTDVHGKVAVVTGAGSGIGSALALELARRGATLSVCDVDVDGLSTTADRARGLGADVHADQVDVSDRAAVLRYAEAVATRYGRVNIVVNNAGIAFTGDIEAMSFEQIERVMDVDFWGVVHGTKAFLPHVIASGDGHVVNVSSVFGLFSVPGQSAYNAAKFAVRGFTEALRQEMLAAGHPVQVTCVHPGGIRTAIARSAGAVDGLDPSALAEVFDARMARTSPEAAANSILRVVRRNGPRALVGADAKLADAAVRVLGPAYQRLVARSLGRVARSRGVPVD